MRYVLDSPTRVRDMWLMLRADEARDRKAAPFGPTSAARASRPNP